MSVADVKKNAQDKMVKSIETLKGNLAKVRTGRAHTGILDHVMVDYYGSPTALPMVANLTLIDARTIGVQPYEKKMLAAYPIHPELFERLYEEWSTLDKFQRTRGVLRLLARVIHRLWEGGDKNLVIMPCSIPLDDGAVRSELTRYLPDVWDPIIMIDVDGPDSLPAEIERTSPNMARLHAARRVARR